MSLLVPVAVQMIVLTGPEHQVIEINPSEVTSIREPRGGAFHGSIRCTIYTADGKFISVTEPCAKVHALIEQIK